MATIAIRAHFQKRRMRFFPDRIGNLSDFERFTDVPMAKRLFSQMKMIGSLYRAARFNASWKDP
jgi:hypothetical protein